MSHTIVGGEFRTSPRLPPLRSPPPDDLPAPSENVVRLSPQRRREQLSDAYRMPAERPPRRTLHLPVASASGGVHANACSHNNHHSPTRTTMGATSGVGAAAAANPHDVEHPLAQDAHGTTRLRQQLMQREKERAAKQGGGGGGGGGGHHGRASSHQRLVNAGYTTRLQPLDDIAGGEAAQSSRDPSTRHAGQRRPDGSDHSPTHVARHPGRVNKRTDPLAAFGYRTLGPIAAGAFSTVVRAQRLEGDRREVAVKSFNRAKYNKQGWLKTALKNELDVLRALQVGHHANVANLLDVHEAHSATHAILEYCGGGSVHRHLRSLRHGHAFSEPFGTLLTAQVCEALAHLHSHLHLRSRSIYRQTRPAFSCSEFTHEAV